MFIFKRNLIAAIENFNFRKPLEKLLCIYNLLS